MIIFRLLKILFICFLLISFANNLIAENPDINISTNFIRYKGIDVSHYQNDINWKKVRKSGITFAFIKATQGNTYVDPKFHHNWSKVKKASIIRGAYHFFDADIDAEAQADLFIKTVHLKKGDLPPVLDIEVTDGVSKKGIDKDIKIWLEKVTKAYGVTPIIYSNKSFTNKYLSRGFNNYPLWIAEYSKTPPNPPGDWEICTFWQESQTGVVQGINDAVDLNIFHGTKTEWNQILKR